MSDVRQYETEVEAQGQTVVVRAGQATWVEPGKAPQPPFYVDLELVDAWVGGALQGEEVGPIESVILWQGPPAPVTATPVVE